MPRDPIDISTHGAAKRARQIAALEDQKDPIRLRTGSGPAGATGPEGPKGEKGATGSTGSEGPKGEKGATGSTGPEGPIGKEGPGGKEGPAGSTANSDWKNSVRAATTANITIATALNNADTLDGLTLATNDRVLVKNQTTKTENGIWVVGVTPTRATDADEAAELSGGSTVYVEAGTVNAKRFFHISTVGNITPGTTAHDWEQEGFKDFGLVSALPTGAIVGDRMEFIAAKGDTIWQFVNDGEGTLPWKFIGGVPLFNEVATGQATASAAYVNLATVGPELKTPAGIKGDYFCEFGVLLWNTTANCHARMGIGMGGAAPSMEIDGNQNTGGGFGTVQASRRVRLPEVPASTAFLAKYLQITGGEANFAQRWLSLIPIRVG